MDAQRLIYLDHAATTPARAEVVERMARFHQLAYGNPSSLYELAEEARNAVAVAREEVAQVLGCRPNEVVFTSGGSESNNAAIKGAGFAQRGAGKHMVVGAIEHPSVKHTARQMEGWGWEVDLAAVDEHGHISPEEVDRLIRPDTAVVSVMLVNNEIGAVQDVAAIGELVHRRAEEHCHPIVMHTDAIQAAGKLELDAARLNVDMLSLSGHKIAGPKGVGALFIKRGTPFEPLIAGGGQERQRRAGTENVPGIAGMGLALQLAEDGRERFIARAAKLRDQLVGGIREHIPGALLNGHSETNVPTIVNVSFPNTTGEARLIDLDFAGIAASSGSACSAASLEPSEVLTEIGLDVERAVASVRFSMGSGTDEGEIAAVLEQLKRIVANLQPSVPGAAR